MEIHYFFIILLILHIGLSGFYLLKPVIRKNRKGIKIQKNQSHFLVVFLLALLVISLGWITTSYTLFTRREENFAASHRQLNEVDITISGELRSIDKAAEALAGSPWLKEALIKTGAESLKAANALLDRYCLIYEASVCYLLDETGKTIASSNRNAPDSFIGSSYHFRPYFQQSRQNQPGYYFALGITSGKRGYYTSAPISGENESFKGAVVIKKEIDFIESALPPENFTSLIDQNGIIFLSSRQDFLYTPLWPLSDVRKQQLTASNQFGQLEFQPHFPKRPADRETVTFENKRSFISIIPFSKEGWWLISVNSFKRPLDIYLFGSLFTLFGILLLQLISIMIVHYKTRQGELVLRENERLYRELLESLPQIIFTCDLMGNITYANKFGVAYFGFTKAKKKQDQNIFRLLVQHEHERVRQQIREMRESHNHIISEYRFLRKNGEIFTGLVHGVPVFHNDVLSGFRGFIVDISRQKQKDAEQNKLNKLESIGILAGGLAHDFNNILASLSNGINYLELKLASDTETADLLKELGVAIKYGKDVTHQLLTFSKGGTPVKEATTITDLIRETADFVLSGSNCITAYNFAENLHPAEIDRGQISQVIQNLCLNAAQAMPGGGVISIEAQNRKFSTGEHETIPAGNYICITITDNGCGIPPEQIPKIFDPFFTTRKNGNGLGLATVHSIIRKHNGYIFATSIPAQKTTFTIFLPASTQKKILPQKQDTSLRKGKGDILVMDDDTLVLQTCTKLLEYLGYTIQTAQNGKEAVEIYTTAYNAGKPFAVVIMDLTIKGGMGGRETLKELLKIDPGVKAIVSSGYSNDPVMANFASYGFAGVISKPYKLEKMSILLKTVIDSLPEG